MRKHHESKLQQACVRWFRLKHHKHIIFAVPNGGRRNAIEAAIMKGEGVLAGVPDLIVLANWKVLFIEMKYGSGRLSENQKETQRKIAECGHKVVTVNTFEDFQAAINAFIG